ncbi:MAG: S9 family peptidase [Gemmatimonadetes bacterium]|nr:S9 family peptidase [Gemmatimonadota bacterium]
MLSIRLVPFIFLATGVAAQPPRQLTVEDYARAERMLAPNTFQLVTGTVAQVGWLPDGRLWYRVSTAGGSAYQTYHPTRRGRAPLFDPGRLAASASAAAGVSVEGNRLPPLEVSPDGRAVTFAVADRRLRCELGTAQCAVRQDPKVPENATVSPDGRWAVLVRDHDLWAVELATGRETQLTSDGVKDFGYATNNAGWTHDDSAVLTWSPDSRRLATFQHDGRGVSEMHLVATKPGAPTLESWKYPFPGDSLIFRISRVVVDLAAPGAPRVVRLAMPPDAHRSTVSDHVACEGGKVCDLQWYPDGSQLAFISSSRDHQRAWVRVANAETGAVRTLFEETSATQIGDASLPENLWRVLPASNELIWWSQRDNWVHLYLFDLATGALKNRITTGDGNVTEIVRVDEKARVIYFVANGRETGRDPYFSHFYRIRFDGRDLALLTPENASHSVSLSPDGKHFVDSYSTMNTPPVTVLRTIAGKLVDTLERADLTRLVAAGWKPPTPITMKGRDGTTDIYGLMYTPTRLDSTKKYPIIDYIYPGPQSGSVGPRRFIPTRGDHQALAELGFVVVQIDGMGTPGRSKAFHDTYYGRMGDNTIPDQVAGITELARRFRFIDLDKVGIWGHSGGGFATAAAMFRHPDFFKVGIAESGNHDNRSYEDDWGERYQGLLVRTGATDNYAAESNATHAANLKGKLYLVHGAMDDNVPATNTYQVADALIKAGKEFDLLILPHARHGFGADGAYMMRRRWDYFVRHLQGAEPPRDYQIGRSRPVP